MRGTERICRQTCAGEAAISIDVWAVRISVSRSRRDSSGPATKGNRATTATQRRFDPSDARKSRRAPARIPPSVDMKKTSGSQRMTQMYPSRWKTIVAAMKARLASQGWKTRRTQLFSDSPNQITRKPSASGTRKMKLTLMMAHNSLAEPGAEVTNGSNRKRQPSP